MIDAFGNEVRLGDKVVVVPTCKGYIHMVRGKITKINPQTVVIAYGYEYKNYTQRDSNQFVDLDAIVYE